MAGAAALQAQVYSVNAVGYINVTAQPGFNLLANQLIAADATVPTLMAGVPDGSIVFKYSESTSYEINILDFGEWGIPGMTLSPGEGFWLQLPPNATATTITFVGEVPQGNLTTDLTAGFNLVSSKVPQAGLVSTDLGLPAEEGDAVYTYTAGPEGGYGIAIYDFGAWDPAEPSVGVGEGFWVQKLNAGTWTRDFSVN
jgi:hypothetical protein